MSNMDKITKLIIDKHNLPRAITGAEAIGKKVKKVTSGCYITDSVYVIFEDNTCISFGVHWHGDSQHMDVRMPGDYGADIIIDFGYEESSEFHNAYTEYHQLKKEYFKEEKRKKDAEEYLRLKEKFGRETPG